MNRSSVWPKWPQSSVSTKIQINEVFDSGLWTISGLWTGSKSKEREFGERFAAFNGVDYCVPVDHGSSSLLVALEALDIGLHDEVIVPALTWVATATSVLNVNAAPVFADVDPMSCCITPQTIEAAITPRTKAIIVVHLHCTMADMDGIMALAESKGLSVIEDCAQAHGAVWRGQRAGTIGHLGCFSMQQGKVLSAGEGGAVITKEARLYRRLQQLRADARIYCEETPGIGSMQLTEVGEVMGSNHCMSEFHAAILLDQLKTLDKKNLIRESNARYLDERLEALGGIRPISRPPALERQSVYEYVVRCSLDAFGGLSAQQIAGSLEELLGFPIYQIDAPLPQNRLYCPWTKRRFAGIDHAHAQAGVREIHFPQADAAHREAIACGHSILLGTREQMDQIVDAFRSLQTEVARSRAPTVRTVVGK